MINNGSLQDFKLPDLINIISQSKKTGELNLNFSETTGSLYFSDGVITNAKVDELMGEEAVYKLMTLKSGDFKFEEKDIPALTTIEKEIDELIKEGSLRLEILSYFHKNDFVNINKSKIILKTDFLLNLDKLSDKQKKIIKILEENKDITIEKLTSILNLNLIYCFYNLKNLLDNGIIEIEKSQEEIFWESFQTIIKTFYLEFTSISGIKVSNDLDKKIQDLIKTNALNLVFKDGTIYSDDMSSLSVEEQWLVYKNFLDELLGYFSKVYGNNFIEKVTKNLFEKDKKLEILLKRIRT